MTEIEELKLQIENLKDTVTKLQNGTIRVETNTSKLARMKTEIIMAELPKEIRENSECSRLEDFRRDVGIITNDLFFLTTNYKYESYKKMAEIIFNRPNPEKRLETYLKIYRTVCKFMAAQYDGHWKTKTEISDELRKEYYGIIH